MKYLFLFLFFPAYSFSQKGEITGSVFFKYNEFVGSRADAGSSVTIFSFDKKNRITTTVDLDGSFKLSNLDTGQYLVIVKSKSTNQDPYWGYRSLMGSNSLMIKYQSFAPKQIDSTAQKRIDQKYDELSNYLNVKNPKAKKIVSLKLELLDLIIAYFTQLPIEKTSLFNLYSPTDKIDYREVSVPSGLLSKIVIDFGITYR